MISYNDIIKITSLYDNKEYNKLLSFVNTKLKSNNILDLLKNILNLKFVNKTDSINLTSNKTELIIYKENFLKNLPEYSETNINIDGATVTISYPSSKFISIGAFIKKIQKDNKCITITEKNYKYIPLTLIKQCYTHIYQYILKLENIFIYYINDSHNSRFRYTSDIINYIVYLGFVQDYDTLLKTQLIAMKNYNFMYQDFDKISLNDFKKYMQQIKKLNNE